MSVRRLLRRLASFFVTMLILWLGGLAWFIASSVLVTVDRTSPTDAIVVLTGGRLRLETGLELLVAGKAEKLFVSGVNPRVDRNALLRVLGPAAEREACCIVLGHAADNTVGNARETASWMHDEGYRSLRLVTSWYHMRRSLLEFSRAMPRVTTIAHPVFAGHSDRDDWSGWYAAVPLVLGEYHKYLAAWVRPLIEAVLPPPVLAPVIRTTAGVPLPRGGGSERPFKCAGCPR
jgi:uncharacterized SAM-binding protein YcdF (DUF218 family)